MKFAIKMDEEQLQLGISEKFWAFIQKRRHEKTISRKELDKKINGIKRR